MKSIFEQKGKEKAKHYLLIGGRG